MLLRRNEQIFFNREKHPYIQKEKGVWTCLEIVVYLIMQLAHAKKAKNFLPFSLLTVKIRKTLKQIFP